MQLALDQAKAAGSRGEVPVGAVVVAPGIDNVLARAGNQVQELNDPTAHAEILAIRAATSKRNEQRLPDCDLYVTLEPCPMCAGAIIQSRIPRIVYGATDPKAGAVTSLYNLLTDTRLNHTVQVTGGVLAEDCGRILTNFFRSKR